MNGFIAPRRRGTNNDLWAWLAFVRFCLASIVLNAHLGSVFSITNKFDNLPAIYIFGRQLGPLAAIIGFLIISGFSIAHSYERSEGFFSRRFARIFPALFVASVIFAVALKMNGPITTSNGITAYPPTSGQFVAGLLALNGIVVGSFLAPAWSLSAEILFYVLTPLLARANTVAISLAVAGSSLIFLLNQQFGIGPLSGALYGLAALSLFWAWGAGFQYYRRPGVASALILLILPSLLLSYFNYEEGNLYFIPCLLPVAVIMGNTYGPPLPLGVRRIFNYLGDISYPLYLLHFPLIYIINGIYGIHNFPIIIAACLATSHICLTYIEKPVSRLLRLPQFVSHKPSATDAPY